MRAIFHFHTQGRFFLYYSDFSIVILIAVNAILVGFWYGPKDSKGGALTLSFSITFTLLSRFLIRAIFNVDICMTSI